MHGSYGSLLDEDQARTTSQAEEQVAAPEGAGAKYRLFRTRIKQARMRLESLSLLTKVVSSAQSDIIIENVVKKVRNAYRLPGGPGNAEGPDDGSLARDDSTEVSRLLGSYTEDELANLAGGVDGIISIELKEKKIDIKPEVLAAWWRQYRNYTLEDDRLNIESIENSNLSEITQRLYQLENADILVGDSQERIRMPNFSSDREQVVSKVKSDIKLLEGNPSDNIDMTVTNYLPTTHGWLLPAQIEGYGQIQSEFKYVRDVRERVSALHDAAAGAGSPGASARLPDWFVKMNIDEQVLLARILQELPDYQPLGIGAASYRTPERGRTAANYTPKTSQARDQNVRTFQLESHPGDIVPGSFSAHLQRFLSCPPSTLRHIGPVRAQAGIHQIDGYNREGNRIYQHKWLRDGSFPAAAYGYYEKNSLGDDLSAIYLGQILVNLLQSIDLKLHLYVQQLQDKLGNRFSSVLGQVRMHPHIDYVSLLSPLAVDNLASRLMSCAGYQFADDNSRMASNIQQVVVALQGVFSGRIVVPQEYTESFRLEDDSFDQSIPVSNAVFELLSAYANATYKGIEISGVTLAPTIDCSNYPVNAWRPKGLFFPRGAQDMPLLDKDLAWQFEGMRGSMLGIVNTIGDMLALNQAAANSGLGGIWSNADITGGLTKLRAKLYRMITDYPDPKLMPLKALVSYEQDVNELRRSLQGSQEKVVFDLSLRLSASSRFLVAINSSVSNNYDLNRELMAASFARIMGDTLGSCKSSSDRYGMQEANMDALIACYIRDNSLPAYRASQWSLSGRYQFAIEPADQQVFLSDFVKACRHQMQVRDALGATSGEAIKSIKGVAHPASKTIFADAGIDLSQVQRTANGVKFSHSSRRAPAKTISGDDDHGAGHTHGLSSAPTQVRAESNPSAPLLPANASSSHSLRFWSRGLDYNDSAEDAVKQVKPSYRRRRQHDLDVSNESSLAVLEQEFWQGFGEHDLRKLRMFLAALPLEHLADQSTLSAVLGRNWYKVLMLAFVAFGSGWGANFGTVNNNIEALENIEAAGILSGVSVGLSAITVMPTLLRGVLARYYSNAVYDNLTPAELGKFRPIIPHDVDNIVEGRAHSAARRRLDLVTQGGVTGLTGLVAGFCVWTFFAAAANTLDMAETKDDDTFTYLNFSFAGCAFLWVLYELVQVFNKTRDIDRAQNRLGSHVPSPPPALLFSGSQEQRQEGQGTDSITLSVRRPEDSPVSDTDRPGNSIN